MTKEKRLIGVFDSGVGGLTVVKALTKLLPAENVCYLADSINLPYGNKSAQDLEEICIRNIQFLTSYPLKALIIACNTASAHIYEAVKKRFNIPIFDVITPSVEEALTKTKNKKIAVLGSESTVNSNIYPKLLTHRMPDCEVVSIACPLLVSVIEENMIKHQISQMLVRQYLASLHKTGIDVVILGCTHYPLMEKAIRKELPEHVELIDSGFCSVIKLKSYLEENNLLEKPTSLATHQFFVTGSTDKFNVISSSFLNQKVNSLKKVV